MSAADPRPDDGGLTPAEAVSRFLAGTITRAEWTHPAHLFVCRRVLAEEPDADAAYARMRTLIRAHNVRIDPEGGPAKYHDTITRYYVDAVAHVGPIEVEALPTQPSLTRDAPLDHWSPEVLWSAAARDHWVEPDRTPLPWPSPGGRTGRA